MEVSNQNIDRYEKEIAKSEEYQKEVEKAFSIKADWVQPAYGGTSELIKRTMNYLVKPQLNFDPPMDNSYFQFVPLITYKENALSELNPKIKQLQEDYQLYKKKNIDLIYEPDNEPILVKYPNPYEDEINALKVDWQEELNEISKTVPLIPSPISNTDFEFIESKEQIIHFLEEVSDEKEIAVDLEFHAYRSYQGFTWLMQLSTRSKDYIIDAILLRSEMYLLNKIFTNPDIIKILHGAKFDILWLQKDFGIYIVNLFDTWEAAKILGLRASLCALLKHYWDIEADKQFQLADWRQRPIPQEMLNYARQDTHYLHYLYDIMRRELLKPKNANENPIKFIISCWKNSQKLCHQLYQKPFPKDTEYVTIMNRNAPLMGEGNIQILDMLLTWRDYIARIEDESTKYVMPNDVMFDIARSAPKDLWDLEVVLGRHPKHTHHDLILKHESDLLSRINQIFNSWAESIKSRVQSENKPLNIPVLSVQMSPTKIESKMYELKPGSKSKENLKKINEFMKKQI